MIPGDRLVCGFVDNFSVGIKFSQWPHHITIVPWFRIPANGSSLIPGLKEAVKHLEPFNVLIGEKDYFGRNKNKEVYMIKEPTPFHDIESKVRCLLKSLNAWIVDESTKRKTGFKPHITIQKSGKLLSNDEFICDSVYIVEQLGQEKIIEAKIRLGNG